MSSLTQEEINVDLFDEVQRFRKENRELKEQLESIKLKDVEKFKELLVKHCNLANKNDIQEAIEIESKLIKMYLEQEEPKKIYLVLQLFDEGYDSVQTEIKLITFDEDKAKKTAEEFVEINKKESNLEYQIEIWENEKYLDTISV